MAEELSRAGSGGTGHADLATAPHAELATAASEEMVTAPDQHRPTNIKWTRIGSVIAIIVLLLMTRPFNNHVGWVEDIFLIGTAAVIAIFLGVDAVLRRNGLRR
ncbi:MAG TPA: DUF2631 domain-containing protein [Natronosporangium sp.]